MVTSKVMIGDYIIANKLYLMGITPIIWGII